MIVPAAEVPRVASASYEFRKIAPALGWILVVAVAVWSIASVETQNASPASSIFDVKHARQTVNRLASAPHPVGTPSHDLVRSMIASTLQQLQIPTTMQDREVSGQHGMAHVFATVHNVVGRLHGTEGKADVVLAAHYDSVPPSPGGSDDGLGVSVLLETARVLSAGPRMPDDVVLLFTDAEEIGLFGAQGFLQNAATSRIRAVLNFEARGVSGPIVMFQTSANNHGLIEALASHAPFIIANSLAGEVYRHLPNDTDFTIFNRAGVPGMNFAIITGAEKYHTHMDTAANLDDRSLQQTGNAAVALVETFGSSATSLKHGGDDVYFNLPPRILIRYPQTWASPLAGLALLVWISAALAAVRSRTTRWGQIAAGFGLSIATAMGAALVAWICGAAMQAAGQEPAPFTGVPSAHAGLVVAAALCFGSALAAAALIITRRWVGFVPVALGCTLIWTLLAIGSALLASGASYLFTWAALFLSCGTWLYVQGQGVLRMLAWVCTAPAVFVVTQTLFLVWLGLSTSGILLLGVISALLIIGLAFFFESPGALRIAGICTSIAGAVMLCVALLSPLYTPAKPKRDTLLFAQNADLHRAVWASIDARPDSWTSQRLGHSAVRGAIDPILPSLYKGFLFAPAPLQTLEPPRAEILNRENSNDRTAIQLRLQCLRQAPILSAWIQSKASALSISVAGAQFHTNPGELWLAQYYAPPASGVIFSVEARPPSKITLRLTDQSYGFPASLNVAPRPSNTIAGPYIYGDSTFATRTFEY